MRTTLATPASLDRFGRLGATSFAALDRNQDGVVSRHLELSSRATDVFDRDRNGLINEAELAQAFALSASAGSRRVADVEASVARLSQPAQTPPPYSLFAGGVASGVCLVAAYFAASWLLVGIAAAALFVAGLVHFLRRPAPDNRVGELRESVEKVAAELELTLPDATPTEPASAPPSPIPSDDAPSEQELPGVTAGHVESYRRLLAAGLSPQANTLLRTRAGDHLYLAQLEEFLRFPSERVRELLDSAVLANDTSERLQLKLSFLSSPLAGQMDNEAIQWAVDLYADLEAPQRAQVDTLGPRVAKLKTEVPAMMVDWLGTFSPQKRHRLLTFLERDWLIKAKGALPGFQKVEADNRWYLAKVRVLTEWLNAHMNMS